MQHGQYLQSQIQNFVIFYYNMNELRKQKELHPILIIYTKLQIFHLTRIMN